MKNFEIWNIGIVFLLHRVHYSCLFFLFVFVLSEHTLYGILLRRETPTYRYWAPVAAARRDITMVLLTASRRNTFVGGTCAPPSALLVSLDLWCTYNIITVNSFMMITISQSPPSLATLPSSSELTCAVVTESRVRYDCSTRRESNWTQQWQHWQKLVVALVHSRLDYGNGVLVGIPAHLMRRLQSVLNAAARLIFNLKRSDHITDALVSLHWLRVPERIQ